MNKSFEQFDQLTNVIGQLFLRLRSRIFDIVSTKIKNGAAR